MFTSLSLVRFLIAHVTCYDVDSVRVLVRVDDHAPAAVPTRGLRAAQDLDRAASQEAVHEAGKVCVTIIRDLVWSRILQLIF